MLNTIGKISLWLLALAALWSCDNRVEPNGISVPSPAEGQVNLSFSVGAVEAVDNLSRASIFTDPDDFEKGIPPYEDIHTLRVIIVRASGLIEHNKYLTENEFKKDKLYDFPVAPGEGKTIYLIANEAATGIDFKTLVEGQPYPMNAIENMTFDATGGYLIDNTAESDRQYVPMSELYSLYVPPYKECEVIQKKTDTQKEIRAISAGTLFVTRAAVKFTFNLTSTKKGKLYLSSLTFNSLANKEYLLPRNTVYSPQKEQPKLSNDFKLTEIEGRFITSYTIPNDAQQSPFVFTFTSDDKPKGIAFSADEPAENISPALYFCESQLGAPYPASNGEPYTVSISFYEENSVNPKTFEAVKLPNLPILPRNTHVVVNIKVNQSEVEAVVELVPYIGVTLKPEFGFDNLKPKPSTPQDPDEPSIG